MKPRTTTIEFEARDEEGLGHKYQHTLHGAVRGVQLFKRVVKAIGGSIGEALGAVEGGLDAEVDFSRMGGAAAELAGKLIEDEQLVVDLLEHTIRVGDGKVPLIFDEAYQGNYGELLHVVARVAWDNFGKSFTRQDPFAALRSLAPGRTTDESSESSASAKSSGKSGASSTPDSPR